MDAFPPEILEQIFAHVSMLELLTIHTRVCKKWNEIISRTLFLPWKKSYHRYKILRHDPTKNDEERESDDEESPPKKKKSKTENPLDMKLIHFLNNLGPYNGQNINRKNHLNPPIPPEALTNSEDKFRLETSAPWLINFLCQEFEIENIQGQFQAMKNHPKFSWASEWIKERMPEVMEKQFLASIPVICAIAEDAWDIEQIFRVLLRPSLISGRSHVISEVLYAIALAFLYLQRKYSLPSKFHYDVYHAISFFENEFNSQWICSPGSSTVQEFALTAEQARIASFKLEKGGREVIKIIAFAGTGKTTSLIKMSQTHPELKFLVIVYNASVAKHAKKVFPSSNVVCTTAHALARQSVTNEFSPRKFCDNLKAKDILVSKLMPQRIGNILQRAAQIVKTLQNFMNSPDPKITLKHVPLFWTKFDKQSGTASTEKLGHVHRLDVMEDSRNIWKAIIDPNDLSIKIPHDGYLKLFQLQNPDLNDLHEHDVLMIDEGQDMNPAVLDIFEKQSVNKIIVGDPNQQIYMFRGAIDALSTVQATQTFYLTQSFRFGPSIGFVANTCLEKLKQVNSKTLIGGKKKDFILDRDTVHRNVNEYKPVAVIGRTNLAIFMEIVKLVCDATNPPKCAMNGGLDSYNFRFLLDIYYLYKEKKHLMKRFKTFDSFSDLKGFAATTMDVDFLGKILIVEHYKDRIPELVSKISQHCSSNQAIADYIFSTTHKAKGLEWKTVILLDDFDLSSGQDDEHSQQGKDEDEENNILYVGLTRAKKYLALNYPLFNLLLSNGFLFEKVVNRQEKVSGKHKMNCLKCKDRNNIVFEDVPIILERSAMDIERIIYKKKDHGQIEIKTEFHATIPGVFCSVCACTSHFSQMKIACPKSRQMIFRSRKFLRYFVGVTPDRYQEGLQAVESQNPDENEHWVAHVFQHFGPQHQVANFLINGVMPIQDFDEDEFYEENAELFV